MDKKSIVIGVATHKPYKMPKGSIYQPIFVGSTGKKEPAGYVRDDQGDNISNENPYYCELTATYYLWKNVHSDYKGLVHYRRHFCNNKHFGTFSTGTFDKVLTSTHLEELLRHSDIVLPQRRHYYIETNYSHYANAHYQKDLDLTRKIVRDLYPEAIVSFDRVMKRRSAHMFNMYVMRSDLFDDYAKWMFSILFKLQELTDISEYSKYEQRLYGFISELLLDVWLDTTEHSFTEIPVMYMEKQSWVKKIFAFLKRKFIAKGAVTNS